MDWKLSSLDIAGYKNQPVPNTLFAQPDETDHLGIILPGYRYPVEMPPLYYAARLLLEGGADLLRVEYDYPRVGLMQASPGEQERWLAEDVTAAAHGGLAQRAYEKVTLVGKSLGTLAMGHLLADPRFQSATCIWLTPLLTVDKLRAQIEEARPRSLLVIGTADRFYQPDLLEELVSVTGGRSLVLAGVNHGLEIPGDIPGSLEVLGQMVEAMGEFLGRNKSS